MGAIASRPHLIRRWEANHNDPVVVTHLENSPGFQRCLVEHIGNLHGFQYEHTKHYWTSVKPFLQAGLPALGFVIIRRSFHNRGIFADDEDPVGYGYIMQDGEWIRNRVLDDLDRQGELWYDAAENVREGIYGPLDFTDQQKADALLDARNCYRKIAMLQNRITALETKVYEKECRLLVLERAVFGPEPDEHRLDRDSPTVQIPEGEELPSNDLGA